MAGGGVADESVLLSAPRGTPPGPPFCLRASFFALYSTSKFCKVKKENCQNCKQIAEIRPRCKQKVEMTKVVKLYKYQYQVF